MSKHLIPPVILTEAGREFDFLHPQFYAYDIDEIAHALSNLCRFTGHTREFYSVAQHSVLVANQFSPDDPDGVFAGLMHDAAEAFVGDVSTPLKVRLKDYGIIEAVVQGAINTHFLVANGYHNEIKEYDLRALATEKRDLMPHTDTVWDVLKGVVPLDERIIPLPPREAKRLFLDLFYECAN